MQLTNVTMKRRGKGDGSGENPEVIIQGLSKEQIKEASTVDFNEILALPLFSGNLSALQSFVAERYNSAVVSSLSGTGEVETEYTRFYEAHPEFVAKVFVKAGVLLTGEALDNAKAAFARKVTGAATTLDMSIADVLEHQYQKAMKQ